MELGGGLMVPSGFLKGSCRSSIAVLETRDRVYVVLKCLLNDGPSPTLKLWNSFHFVTCCPIMTVLTCSNPGSEVVSVSFGICLGLTGVELSGLWTLEVDICSTSLWVLEFSG